MGQAARAVGMLALYGHGHREREWDTDGRRKERVLVLEDFTSVVVSVIVLSDPYFLCNLSPLVESPSLECGLYLETYFS